MFNADCMQLLRLRQLCAHVALCQASLVDMLEEEDLEQLAQLATNEKEISDDSKNLLYHLRDKLRNLDGKTVTRSRPGDMIIQETEAYRARGIELDDSGPNGGKHDSSYHFSKLLVSVTKSEEYARIIAKTKCMGCNNKPAGRPNYYKLPSRVLLHVYQRHTARKRMQRVSQ
jgi:ferredoxin